MFITTWQQGFHLNKGEINPLIVHGGGGGSNQHKYLKEGMEEPSTPEL